MSSTPFTSCSIGVATVSAMTSGGAPGYEARTTIVGGTTSGYWATGSTRYARLPSRIVTIERTAAKIGRSMKKCERPTVAVSLDVVGRRRRLFRQRRRARARRDRLLLGRHDDVGAHALESRDDD